MTKNETKQIEIGPNLALLVGAIVACFALTTIFVGGCAVDGYFKAKAAESLLRVKTHEIRSPGAIGLWGIQKKRKLTND